MRFHATSGVMTPFPSSGPIRLAELAHFRDWEGPALVRLLYYLLMISTVFFGAPLHHAQLTALAVHKPRHALPVGSLSRAPPLAVTKRARTSQASASGSTRLLLPLTKARACFSVCSVVCWASSSGRP